MKKAIENSDFKKESNAGFSLIELSVVLVVLSTLGAIAIPNILNTIKLNRGEEAKALMNSYIAECLGQFRASKSAEDFNKVSPSSFSEDRLNAIGYKTKGEKTKCNHFAIQPSNEKEDVLFPFDFRIDGNTGNVLKTATPADNKSSLNSCKSWAGNNCGASEEQKKEWARLAALAKAKSDCTAAFLDWKNKPSSGSFNRWDDQKRTCTNSTWVFEGRITGTKKAYDEALKLKYGEMCKDWEKSKFNKKTTGGPMTIKECGGRQFYFYLGQDQSTLELMNEKIRLEKVQQCEAKKEAARKRGHNKKYKGIPGPDPCGIDVWMCKGVVVKTEAAWKATSCGAPPPPPPKPTPQPVPKPAPKPKPVPPPGKPEKFCTISKRICNDPFARMIFTQCKCWYP